MGFNVKLIVCGDSNCQGVVNNYPVQLEAAVAALPSVDSLTIANLSVTGDRYVEHIARFQDVIDAIDAEKTNVLLGACGNNDLYLANDIFEEPPVDEPARTQAQVEGDTEQFLSLARNAGITKIALRTVPARAYSGTNWNVWLPDRIGYNEWLRAGGGELAGVAISDLPGEDPLFEYDPSQVGTPIEGYSGVMLAGNYGGDDTHFNDTPGTASAVAIDTAAIATLLRTVNLRGLTFPLFQASI